MIRKTILILFIGFTLYGCNDNKSQETTLLNEVIKMHDKVMTDDGLVMKNKMQLKSLAASVSAPAVKDSAVMYSKLLDSADDVMMTWMNKFNPDFTGKPHPEIMDYLNKQKAQIVKIDSTLNTAIAASSKYISKNKAK